MEVNKNAKYQKRANKSKRSDTFEVGDLVWIRLKKERFPVGSYGKLKPRADGPFRVKEKINDNAYKIDLPEDYGVSDTFNVEDLTHFHGEPQLEEMMAAPSLPRENDRVGPKEGAWKYYSRRISAQTEEDSSKADRTGPERTKPVQTDP